MDQLSSESLYSKSIEFLIKNDYDNHFIYMTAAADKGYKLAIIYLEDDYMDKKLHLKQNHHITMSFYKANWTYPFSCNYLGYMCNNGIGVNENKDVAYMLYMFAAAKGNEVAQQNVNKNFSTMRSIINKELFNSNEIIPFREPTIDDFDIRNKCDHYFNDHILFDGMK